MVISVLSFQETEFIKDNTAPTPTPIYSFVDDVTNMMDITPPPPKAKKRPVKLAVVKYKRAWMWNLLWPQLWTQCESPEIHCTSCHAFLKATGFGCALYWFILFALLFTKLRCRSNTMTWSCCSSGTSPNMLTLQHSFSVVQNELTVGEGNLIYSSREFSDLFIKKYWFFCQKNYISFALLSCQRPCRPKGGFGLVVKKSLPTHTLTKRI